MRLKLVCTRQFILLRIKLCLGKAVFFFSPLDVCLFEPGGFESGEPGNWAVSVVPACPMHTSLHIAVAGLRSDPESPAESQSSYKNITRLATVPLKVIVSKLYEVSDIGEC